MSHTFEEHMAHLKEVFRRLRQARLRLNTAKCHFCRDRLKYLGHIVDQEGIRTDPDKVSAITNWPAPTTVRQIRQFLGMASWYRRFVPGFSTIAAPLTALTRKNARFVWTQKEEGAFKRLKRTLTTAPVLTCPDFSRPFILQTDASAQGLGAVLTQNLDQGERVIAYASRTLNQAEKNYSATELECLAVVWAIRRMRDYLEGYRFTVVTDHQSLKWLQRLESPTGRLGRWVFELQQFDFDIRYRKGTLNKVADALSRQPESSAIQRSRKCAWYQSMARGVRKNPDEYPDYRIQEGKLYRHVLHSLDFQETPAHEQWKRCVATPDRSEILHRFHDDPTAGHLGIAKTIARVARLYYWPGMYREITRYVRECPDCARYKASQQLPAGRLHATSVNVPWQQVSVDLIGPLPRSTRGHTWLLTMQDRFSKWLELAPLRQATADNVAKEFTDRIIYRHGCPDVLISDNGTQFKSRQFKELLRAFGTVHRTTPAYAPQCNPVERANRTVKTMVAQYVGKRHRNWDENIPQLQFAFNTAKQETTGYTPAFLIHGRELALPHPDDRRRPRAIREPADTRKDLDDAFEVVRINLARSFQHQQRHYDLRRRDWRPRIGERVWKRDHPLSDKSEDFNAKLAPRFRGPMTVRKIISPVIVDLRDDLGQWHRRVHIRDLKNASPGPEGEVPGQGEDPEKGENTE